MYKGDRVFDSEQARVLAEMYSGLEKEREAMQKELGGLRHGYENQKTMLQQYNTMSGPRNRTRHLYVVRPTNLLVFGLSRANAETSHSCE